MRHAILGVLAVFIGFALGGCLKHPEAFHCSGDETCDSGRRCIDGACAKVDPACESGYRWDDTAGKRTGNCAVASPDDGGTDGGDNGLCGNGVVEEDEKCDPGLGSTTPCPTDVKDCDDGEPCTDDVIIGSGCERECAHTYKEDHTSCRKGDQGGACRKGVCCTGCWNGTACVDGSLVGECGINGADCNDCQQLQDACNKATCTGGNCAAVQTNENGACFGGICHAGACCEGCWDGTKCAAGNSDSACGTKGATCVDCKGSGCVDGACSGCTAQCTGKSCGSDGCGGSCGSCDVGQYCGSQSCLCNGSAENTDALCGDGIDNDCNGKKDCADAACDGMRCMQTSGWFCKSNACIAGCRISLASGSNDASGIIVAAGTSNPANPCEVCDPVRDEQGWSPVTPGTGCKANGSSGACTMGMCCVGCIDELGRCRSGILLQVCGGSGGSCASCDDSNPCTEDSCDAGTCKHVAVADGTVCGSKCGSGSDCDSLGGLSCGLGGGSCAVTLATCKSGQCATLSKPTAKCCSGQTPACCAAPTGAYCGNCK